MSYFSITMICRRYFERTRNACHRFSVRRCSLPKCLVAALLLSVISFFVLSYHLTNPHVVQQSFPPKPSIKCRFDKMVKAKSYYPRNHTSWESLRIGRRVLVLVISPYSRLAKSIVSTLQAVRVDYKVEITGKNIPTLTHTDKGRFGVIIFESFDAYINMDSWNRELLDKYCIEYDVGMIAFVREPIDIDIEWEHVPEFPLTLHYNTALLDYRLNEKSDIWRITRPGETIEDNIPGVDWTHFRCNHSTYRPLAYARPALVSERDGATSDNLTLVPAVQDLGLYDGIKRILIGNDFEFWIHRMIFLDSISYLSHGKLSLPLERYIQVDIDDIFVGKSGIRMKVPDVEALVKSQDQLKKVVDGFRFNLGFSGGFFRNGSPEENEGDEKLIEYAHKFRWFGHMWRHGQPHKFNQQSLERSMIHNYQFAKDHGIPVEHKYSVAPHHSGVYPIHEELYEAWKNIWDVRVTSTEEYPHLYPFWKRRGFIHKGIMVLPRQTSGLFTHTVHTHDFPGGKKGLDASIRGGELFLTLLFNPINIYMTHLSNYGNDRLALYTFESVIKFVQCWTNIQLQQIPPMELAIRYFEMFPNEASPIWQNPCKYDRHMEIWSTEKDCNRLPQLLVIGPQKTGTTALYTFLAIHPAITSNYNSPDTFEEVQFFNGNNYYKGLDWYMEFFPAPENSTSDFLFEKSATYFDSELVPMRAHALLPNAKFVCILISSSKRAYSWYQHMRAHGDPTATNYTFYDLITATETAPRKVRELRNRCLNPSMYSQHLMRWLDYYPSRQMLIIDGEQLKSSPIAVMDKVQHFLHIEPFFNYTEHLRYDSRKGFYCLVSQSGKNKCLGRSKGRTYPEMDEQTKIFLQQYFWKHNLALSKLLNKLNYDVPDWLKEELR